MPQMFGRQAELAKLQTAYKAAVAGDGQFVVMFGRRQVGKTFLLRHFAASAQTQARVIFYAATEESADIQREALRSELRNSGLNLLTDAGSGWSATLGEVFKASESEPIVLIIDEAPYLVDKDPAWGSVLQRLWDAYRAVGTTRRLLLIINGSSMSTMTSLISSGGALFGRPTVTMRIDPFDLATSHEAIGANEGRATIEAHAICGGYPLLLARWDASVPVLQNVRELTADQWAPLTINARTLLLDIAGKSNHQAVLRAVGRGAHKLSEISARLGKRAEYSLDVLEQAGFIRKRIPIGEPEPKKNVRYEVSDWYLKFWFDVIDRNAQQIEAGQGAAIVDQSEELIVRHLSKVFEHEAVAHAKRLVETEQLPRMVVGEWWRDGSNGAQIDVVGTSSTNKRRWALAGECKWAESFSRSDLQQLEKAIDASGHSSDDPMLASWSIGGPADSVRDVRPLMRHYTVTDMVST